jgi:uncharacterized protein YndB with AHSA1/START domain
MPTVTDRTESAEPTEDFRRTKTFTASPEHVLAALCTTEGVNGWWGPTMGSPTQGGTFAVGFGSGRRIDLVAASVRPERVEWKVEEAPFTPEWAGTSIVFDIAPTEGGSELRFRHVGLNPQLDCFDMCEAGWTHYLASLVAYVDSGAGDPYRPQ